MAATPCPDRALLEQLVLGLLSDAAAEGVEGHVGQCRRCLALLRSLELEDGLVRTLRAGARAEPLGWDEVDSDVVARLCRLRQDPPPRHPAGKDLPPRQSAADTVKLNGSREKLVSSEGLSQKADVPDRVGPFPIVKLLGAGGMGVVYQVWQLRPRRPAALKVSRGGPWADRKGLARFLSEIELVAQLQHPNIVPIYEAGEHAGQPYFLMELLEGGSLAQKLAVAPLAPRAAATLIETLARAIGVAHERGVIHRDLKPANVLLASDGTPKITDFGLAKQLAALAPDAAGGPATESGLLMGTPAYMAPEQACGQSEVGPAVDVYALGAILYECLTGRPPFKAASVVETLDQVRSREPVPPSRLQPGLPRDLQTVCLKCLAKAPTQRYGSAAALAEDLGCFLAGKPVAARPVPPWVRAWKWARRQPAAAALLALSLLAVVSGVSGVLVHNARLRQAADEAQRQHKRADVRYQAARDSLRKILNRLHDRQLADAPRLKELHRGLLEDALAFYQGVLDHADDPDPEVRLDTAFARADVGIIHTLLGQSEAAEDFRRALALLEQLPAELRDRPDCREKRAVCHGYLGTFAGVAGRADEGERHLRAELALFEQLAADEPANPRWQNEVARAEHHLGRLYLDTGRQAEAEQHYRRAVGLRRQLVASQPAVEQFRAHLAESCINLDMAISQQGRRPARPTPLEEAIKLLENLVEQAPDAMDYKLSLAAAYCNRGGGCKDRQEFREGQKWLDRAVQLCESILRQEPQHGFARAFAFNAHGARAQLHEGRKDWAAAVRDWDRVVALDTQPNPWIRRALRANARVRAGDYTRATAEAEALARDPAVNEDGLYNLACTHALAVEMAQKDTTLPAGQRQARAGRHASQALALLHRLERQGYFRNAGHASCLATDEDLRVLHGRPDFEQLRKSGLPGKEAIHP